MRTEHNLEAVSIQIPYSGHMEGNNFGNTLVIFLELIITSIVVILSKSKLYFRKYPHNKHFNRMYTHKRNLQIRSSPTHWIMCKISESISITQDWCIHSSTMYIYVVLTCSALSLLLMDWQR